MAVFVDVLVADDKSQQRGFKALSLETFVEDLSRDGVVGEHDKQMRCLTRCQSVIDQAEKIGDQNGGSAASRFSEAADAIVCDL